MSVTSENVSEVFTSRLKARLKSLGWDQRRLASELECSDAYVSQLVRGRGKPSIKTLAKLAEVLRVAPKYFLENPNE